MQNEVINTFCEINSDTLRTRTSGAGGPGAFDYSGEGLYQDGDATGEDWYQRTCADSA